MIAFEPIGKVLQVADIQRLETAIGHALPTQYRNFLLAHNGGRPKPNIVDIEGAYYKGADIQVFYGLDTDLKGDDILHNLQGIEGCKEAGLVPIANDSGANMFFLVFSGQDAGCVYFEHMREDPPRVYLVAPDFNAFLAKIRDFTPEEWAEIDAMIGKNDPGSDLS